MCISNLANESEFLNEISNMENQDHESDRITTEGLMRLNAEVQKDNSVIKFERREAMFDELLDALQGAVNDLRLQGFAITANQYSDVLKRAKALR